MALKTANGPGAVKRPPSMLLSEEPSKCTWSRTAAHSTAPHRLDQHYKERKPILDDIMDFVGHTPMVRINHIGKEHGVKCELVAKCEFFNAGGSVKDRAALRMIEEGEREGYLVPGVSTIIEPTSGNTGIAMALICAVRNYRCIIVMPDKMSQEKADILHALGAEVIRTPSEEGKSSPNSHINVAMRMSKEIPNAVMLNQYRNPANPVAHYDTTAEEIWQQCGGKLDMVVVGCGTGGTICGIARKFQEICPHVTIVGVDPEGSYIADTSDRKQHPMFEVEGIGYDFVPATLDPKCVNVWVKVKDADVFPIARDLMRKEGLLCGGSSGAAMWAALQVAKNLRADQRCAVILPDSIRNYMSKHLKDDWMIERNFGNYGNDLAKKISWWSTPLNKITSGPTETINSDQTCSQAYRKLENSISNALLVYENNKLLGAVTLESLLNGLRNGQCTPESPVKPCVVQMKKVPEDACLGILAVALRTDGIVSIVHRTEDSHMMHVRAVTMKDVMKFLFTSGQ